jgi:hypothetical protein
MAAIFQRSNGRFQAKVRKAGHSVSKTFDTSEEAQAWAKRFETGLKRYRYNVSDNTRAIEMAPLLGFMPLRVLNALSRTPYTQLQILEAAVQADSLIGIYFLIHRDEIVYVGQSKTDVLSRISRHKREGKVFDQYTFMQCKPEKIDELEALYIDAFFPRNNTSARVFVPKV